MTGNRVQNEICVRALTVDTRIKDVEFSVKQGQLVHLIGKNGAGKSTLLSAMAGMTLASNGDVYIKQAPISTQSLQELASQRGYFVGAEPVAFTITVRQFLSFVSHDTQAMAQLDSTLSLQGLMDAPMNALSHGELQRVSLAYTLLPHCSALDAGEGILLLDEPFTGLDLWHQRSVMRYLRAQVAQGNTIVMAHHSIEHITPSNEAILTLSAGRMLGFDDTIASVDLLCQRLESCLGVNIAKVSDEQGHVRLLPA